VYPGEEEEGESDEEYYTGQDFNEDDAITNGVMLGMSWEAIKEMINGGYGHLLAQGYPDLETYLDHMKQEEDRRKLAMPQNLTHLAQAPIHQNPQGPQNNTYVDNGLHFPPLENNLHPHHTSRNNLPSMGPPLHPLSQNQRGQGRGRGRGSYRGGGGRRPRAKDTPRRPKVGPFRRDVDHLNLSNEDCRFYLTGTCSKGFECTYRHCAEAKNTSAICEAWQSSSKCTDAKCKFLHPTKQVEAKLCHFFLRGVCKSGDSCKFLHSKEEINTETAPETESEEAENGTSVEKK